ncbi:ATP-binding cassette domain-containing protein [Erysipelothrix urinaevulpis]|uniref:ATP-binding cassette domain-containing protein n=1 Tax=Erysipelothrix urinaevulpis TaxID=2683717 RepID=UPI00135CF20F|nr:ATP-binding cassette domain-containing protein [Erysipelothrix urinaevulpis]
MNYLECKKITHSFANHTVITDFSYVFESGRSYALVGQSGCGKSTLLNIIARLLKPSSGTLYFNNTKLPKPFTQQSRTYLNHDLSYIFQNYALIDNVSIYENLKLVSNNKHAMVEALETVGLNTPLNQKIFTLSGGEQQRVAIARSLLKEFKILLADEPTGNLDEDNAKQIMAILNTIKNQHKIIIIATHNQEIASLCDEIISLP